MFHHNPPAFLVNQGHVGDLGDGQFGTEQRIGGRQQAHQIDSGIGRFPRRRERGGMHHVNPILAGFGFDDALKGLLAAAGDFAVSPQPTRNQNAQKQRREDRSENELPQRKITHFRHQVRHHGDVNST